MTGSGLPLWARVGETDSLLPRDDLEVADVGPPSESPPEKDCRQALSFAAEEMTDTEVSSESNELSERA